MVTLKYPIGKAQHSEVLYGPHGEPTKVEYDATGRVISNCRFANSGSESADAVSIEPRTYDGSGRLLTDTLRIGNGPW